MDLPLEECDFYDQWFRSGLHHILERILMNLPVRYLLACNTTSKTWYKITNFFLKSDNPRRKRIVENRITAEWNRAEPSLGTVTLCVNYMIGLHMVADEHNVIIPALVTHPDTVEDEPKIFILDTKTLGTLHIISLPPWIQSPREQVCEITLSLSENYLAATVICSPVDSDWPIRQSISLPVWDRRSNFSPTGSWLKREHYNDSVHTVTGISRTLVVKPVLNEDTILVPVVKSRSATTTMMSCERWKISNDDHAFERNMLFYKRCQHDQVDFLPINNKGQYLSVDVSTICLHTEVGEILWEHVFLMQDLRVTGFNDEFFAIVGCSMNSFDQNILNVCHLRDGSPKICLDLKDEFVMISAVQINHGRVAVQGFVTIDAHIANDNFGLWELIVLDLETGRIMVRCAEDFNFPCDGRFVLERSRILVQTENRIHFAKFWI